VAPEEGFEPPA